MRDRLIFNRPTSIHTAGPPGFPGCARDPVDRRGRHRELLSRHLLRPDAQWVFQVWISMPAPILLSFVIAFATLAVTLVAGVSRRLRLARAGRAAVAHCRGNHYPCRSQFPASPSRWRCC